MYVVRKEHYVVKRTVILFSTYEQALSYRKKIALSNPNGLFGINVETPYSWLVDTWERFGDGRVLISPLERAFAVKHILDSSDFDFDSLSVTDGTISLISRFFADLLGSRELENALVKLNFALSDGYLLTGSKHLADLEDCVEENREKCYEEHTFSDAELALLSLVSPYRKLLQEKGLVEPGDALTALSELDLPFEFEFGLLDELSLPFQRFFCSVAPSIIAQLETTTQITKTPDNVKPFLLLADGPSAQNTLITSAVLSAIEERYNAEGLNTSVGYCATEVDSCSKAQLASDINAQRTTDIKAQLASDINAQSAADKNLATIDNICMEKVPDRRNASILIVSSDTQKLFEYVSNAYVSNAVVHTPKCQITSFELRTATSFSETDFGRAFNALKAFLLNETHNIDALLDFVDSPFSGIDSIQAAQIVSAVHGDRLLSFEEAHAMIHLMSPHFDTFEELFHDSDASLVLDYFYDVATEIPGKDAAYRNEQGSAIFALRSVYEQARVWHLSPGEFDFALDGISIDSSCVVAIESQNNKNVNFTILVVSPDKVKDYFGQSFDYVYLCDLDSRYYSADERHDALSTLEGKLGITQVSSQLQIKRAWFEQVKALATKSFICQRVLTSGEDEDIYPSFLWDEFVACYRVSDEELEEIDNLPTFWENNSTRQSELQYDKNANCYFAHKEPRKLEHHSSGRVSDSMDQYLFLSRIGQYDREKLVLSPSAIEQYVNCPYSWFVSQRLRPESPDEELGPLEQGTFVHSVFDEFYKTLPAVLGQARVTEDNLKQAQSYLCDVLDKQLTLQPDSQSTRYVPVTPMEKAEAEKLKQTLLTNLLVQSRLMPEFSPAYSEYVISPKDNCEYAGVIIRGRIDRIDVNAALGQYVVVDYKGGITGHDAGYDPDSFPSDNLSSGVPNKSSEEMSNSVEGNSFEGLVQEAVPHKIQTLIYAQALRTFLPERPVGALYLSYRAQEYRNSVAGSYDDSFLDLTGFARRASAVKINFASYLSLVEGYVARRLDEMKAGNIEQKPLTKDSCKYCPVATCPRRLS